MNPDLTNLRKLQDLASAARELADQIARVPTDIAALEARARGAHERLEAANKAAAEVAKKRRGLEQDLKDAEAKARKYADQLSAIKNNNEYKAVNLEIAHEKKHMAEIEERILINLEETDALANEERAAHGEVKEADNSLAQDRLSLEADGKRLALRKAEVEVEATRLEASLPASLLSLYRRIAHSRAGIGISDVLGESCTVCRVRVRPQVLSVLRATGGVTQCESCSRILYWRPEGAAQT